MLLAVTLLGVVEYVAGASKDVFGLVVIVWRIIDALGVRFVTG